MTASPPSPKVRIAGLAARWQRLVPGRPPKGLGLFVPVDPNDVLDDFDDATFQATDERMPYFAALWSSAEALAHEVMRHEPSLESRRVLDLGCGLGACGLAAARRGAHVVFLDWEPRALEFVEHSAQAQDLTFERSVAADWRKVENLGRFDLVLGADVLYEPRNVPAVAQFLLAHLHKDSEVWLTDPGRRCAEAFPAAAREVGLACWSTFLPRKYQGDRITWLRCTKSEANHPTLSREASP